MSDQPLHNQVALIIGAGREPGPGIAQALAAQGAAVALNDLSPVLLDPIADRLQAQGSNVRTYIADATRGMPLRAMLDEVLSDLNQIDILVNNPRIQPEASLLTMDEWDWQRTVEMNLNGPFLLMQLVARLMQEQGRGIILNIVDADPTVLDAPGRAAYGASQRGLLTLSQAAAREFIAYNIRVYTICMTGTNPHAATGDPALLPNGIPSPCATMSGLAAYLCGPDAAEISGQVYWVEKKDRITP